jgi:hypothetical protein
MQQFRGGIPMTLCKYSLCLVVVASAAGCVTSQPSTGMAALSWTKPTTNTNGSPLLNLAGYRIHYGARRDALSQSIVVFDPATTSYTLQGLASGTWYFAISACTTAGTSSTLSAVVSKTIQ